MRTSGGGETEMELFRNAYFFIEQDRARQVVVLRRTAERFQELDAIDACFAEVGDALAPLPREAYGLLMDLRGGPMRNDEAFEMKIREVVVPVYRGWRTVAVLVKSAVGSLQLQRQGRDDGMPSDVFQDEEQALAFLSAVDG